MKCILGLLYGYTSALVGKRLAGSWQRNDDRPFTCKRSEQVAIKLYNAVAMKAVKKTNAACLRSEYRLLG